QRMFEMRSSTGKSIQVFHRKSARTTRAVHANRCVERDQCHREIRRVGRYTLIARAEYCVAAVDTTDRSASRTGRAFVARGTEHAEVGTAHTLHKVAAD